MVTEWPSPLSTSRLQSGTKGITHTSGNSCCFCPLLNTTPSQQAQTLPAAKQQQLAGNEKGTSESYQVARTWWTAAEGEVHSNFLCMQICDTLNLLGQDDCFLERLAIYYLIKFGKKDSRCGFFYRNYETISFRFCLESQSVLAWIYNIVYSACGTCNVLTYSNLIHYFNQSWVAKPVILLKK